MPPLARRAQARSHFLLRSRRNIDLHPNLVFINAASDQHYSSCKAFYHDEGRLLAARHPGRGIRTMVVDLPDHITAKALPTAPLGEVNKRWRAMHEAH